MCLWEKWMKMPFGKRDIKKTPLTDQRRFKVVPENTGAYWVGCSAAVSA